MRYLRGEVLGLFCGELGIHPDARVAIARRRHGLLVWDLSAGVEYNLDFQQNTLVTELKPVPARCHTVFHESNSTLLARLSDPSLLPWSEERESLLSELRYRNLYPATSTRQPLRPLLNSLLGHLGSRFNPLRLLRPRYGVSGAKVNLPASLLQRASNATRSEAGRIDGLEC